MWTMGTKVEKLLYDRRSAAFALSISIRLLDYYIANKQIRTQRIGRKVMITAAELRRFAASNHYGSIAGKKAAYGSIAGKKAA
jgi:chromosome condensin MukBEF complex kleisin-like MukF subunit